MSVPAADVQITDIPRGFGWNGGTDNAWRSGVESAVTDILFTPVGDDIPAAA
jgi:hypothetical protein